MQSGEFTSNHDGKEHSPIDVFCHHEVLFQRIQQGCNQFVYSWNYDSLRTEHNLTSIIKCHKGKRMISKAFTIVGNFVAEFLLAE